MKSRVTVNQIASKLGLSQPAVSQVLNGTGRISPVTRKRVLEAAERMGYRPNAAARAMITRKTRQVGILVLNNPSDPDTYPQTYYTILGANMALEAEGYVLCLVRIGDVEHAIEGHSRVFREHVLDGVIVTTAIPEHLCLALEKLVPVCVYSDTNVWRPTMCIRRDEFHAGALVGEAVVRAGYRKAVWLTESTDAEPRAQHYSHAERERGLRSVLDKAGVHVTTVQKTWFWAAEFARQFRPLLQPDTAVVAFDVPRARLAAQVALEYGLRPGKEFGLACCESVPEITTGWPNLARVDFDRFRLGRRSAEMMLDLLTGEETAPPSLLLQDDWVDGPTLKTP